MLNKVVPASLFTFLLVMMPAVTVLAAENDNGGFGLSEIIFTILAFVVLALFVFYMFKDNAK